ncbi:MAG: sugar ABC transporter substrate-binding protein [Anaerolineales bacterium]|nr:sugar ABC transporter substrate-binding protein [Anaerolineales bacterium]
MRLLRPPYRAALALSVALAAGCAPAATNTPAHTPMSPTAAPTTSRPVSWMVHADPNEVVAFQKVAEAFEARHPGVSVTLVNIATGDADYFARLGSDLVAGTPADVVYMDYRDAARYYANHAFQPITAQFAASDVIAADDFYAPALNAYQWEGDQMCIPINMSSLVTYYNKDLFDAAGLAYPKADWTWADFLTTAQALTQDTDGDGVVDQYGLGTATQLIRVLPFIWQNGGDFLTADGHDLALDTPEALQALQFFVDLQAVHHVTPGRIEEEAQSSQDRFENGTLGMFFQSRRVTVALRASAAFDWDVAPLPRQAQAATILHSDGLCLTSAAAQPELGWQLIEFANSVEGQQLMAATGRTVPSNRAVAESEYFLDPNVKPEHSRVWIDVIPGLRPAPVLAQWEEIAGRADDEIERAFYGDITAQAALDLIVADAGPRLTED